MRKFLRVNGHYLVIALLIGFASGTFLGKWYAGESDRPRWKKGEMKQHMIEKLSKNLRLTEDQKKQIMAIFEAHHPQMTALHEEMRLKFEAIRNETNDQIKAVLTPQQQLKFDTEVEKMEKRWKDRGKRPGP